MKKDTAWWVSLPMFSGCWLIAVASAAFAVVSAVCWKNPWLTGICLITSTIYFWLPEETLKENRTENMFFLPALLFLISLPARYVANALIMAAIIPSAWIFWLFQKIKKALT